MLDVIESAVRVVRNEGISEFVTKAAPVLKEKLYPVRDRKREIAGPAAKIYDCFIFYDELDILEIRLNVLDEIVDEFVIIEAKKTHQGDNKELHFQNNRDRYEDFNDKIIHHAIEFPKDIDDPRDREHYQRDCIHKALRESADVQPQDEVIISDVDEIPNPDKIKEYIDYRGVKIFSQKLYYYFLNYEIKGGYRWFGSVMAKYGRFTSPQDFRERFCQQLINIGSATFCGSIMMYSLFLRIKLRSNIKLIPEGGWHFSYIGDVNDIIGKIEAFSHAEYNSEEYKYPERIRKSIENGEDILGREYKYESQGIENLPDYLQTNKKEYSDLIISK